MRLTSFIHPLRGPDPLPRPEVLQEAPLRLRSLFHLLQTCNCLPMSFFCIIPSPGRFNHQKLSNSLCPATSILPPSTGEDTASFPFSVQRSSTIPAVNRSRSLIDSPISRHRSRNNGVFSSLPLPDFSFFTFSFRQRLDILFLCLRSNT